MRRLLPLVLLSAFLSLAVGCLADLESTCQSDADCPAGHSCAPGEIRSCVADPGAGGSGGDGGTGGAGGAGGDGGSGGTGGGGGSEIEPVDVPVQVQFRLSLGLENLLEETERPVHQLVVRYEHVDGMQVLELPLDPAWRLVDEPAEPLEFTVEATYEEVKVTVEAHALVHDGTDAVFAQGSAYLPVDEAAPVEPSDSPAGFESDAFQLEVMLGLDSEFDFDGDGDPDLFDCKPDDRDIFRGSPDACDGEVTSCGPALCTLELPEEQHARDLACSPATGLCVAAVGAIAGGPPAEGSGSIRIYPTDFEGGAEPIVVDVADPLGVAVNDHAANDSIFLFTTSTRIRFLSLEGLLHDHRLSSSGDLNGPLAVSPFGKTALAFRDRPVADVFDPTESLGLLDNIVGKNDNCGASGSICSTVDFNELEKDNPLNSEALPIRAVATQSSSTNDPVFTVITSNEARANIMRINSRTREISGDASGTLKPLPTSYPRSVSIAGVGNVIVFAGGAAESEAEAVWLRAGNDAASFSSPTPFPLPEGSCPAALDGGASASSLLMADDCGGRVWRIPLAEEGHPTETADVDAVEIALPDDCKSPSVLASIPGTGDEEPVTFVACKGSNRIVVLGRN